MDRYENAEIGRLARYLQFRFQIRDGDALVFALGDGSQRNNREALRHWLARELEDPELSSIDDTLHELERRLELALHEICARRAELKYVSAPRQSRPPESPGKILRFPTGGRA